MTCSTCGVPGHNSRGCRKFDKKSAESTSKTGQRKNKKQKLMSQVGGEGTSKTKSSKSKQPVKTTHRILIDEDVESCSPFVNVEITEDLNLTAPQLSQDSTSNQSFFCPSPVDPYFEEDIPWRPRNVSEFKSRILERQKPPKPIGTRQINFIDDRSIEASELYAPKGLTWEGNASITGRQLEQLRVEKLKTRKGKGKAQQ